MKKFALPVLALVLVSLALFQTSCDKVKEGRFIIPITLQDVTVDEVTFTEQQQWHTFTSEVITTSIEDTLNSFGASLADIQKIQTSNLVVRITGPAGATFDDIRYADAYLLSPGLDTVKVAYYNDSIPQTGLTELSFSSDYADLSEHLTAPQFTFYARGFYTDPKSSFDISIDFDVEVIAEIED
ncbi:MAG: hypothetical protein NXI00_23215 [Cytophagales bacterium]|nr:hypothetical protein [Cytophagales bacterium]